MTRFGKTTETKILRRIVPIVFVATIGAGVAACGSSAGSGSTNNAPPSSPTPTTVAKSGGAGF